MTEKECNWKLCGSVFFVFTLGLIVGFVTFSILSVIELKRLRAEVCNEGLASYIIANPEKPVIFADLSPKEIRSVFDYVKNQSDLNIVHPEKVNSINVSYVNNIELMLPKKSEVVAYLEGRAGQPQRNAKVVIFRGDKRKPVVEEYNVGPLPEPTQHTLQTTVPFSFRPASETEWLVENDRFIYILERDLGRIMRESYGSSLLNCGARCLTFYLATPVSSTITRTEERLKWIMLSYQMEYSSLYPLDMNILLDLTGNNPTDFSIKAIWYEGQLFKTITEFVDRYQNDPSVKKVRRKFPVKNGNLFSTANLRGETFPTTGQRRVYQTEPDGKRYRIVGSEIEYMKWKFIYRLSPVTGPQLFNIRYQEERIIYELSLQEVAVHYSGQNPGTMLANYYDSFAMYGRTNNGLIPGADCPEHSLMIPTYYFSERSKDIVEKNPFSICVFEQNTGIPLRRHHSSTKRSGRFYTGMMDDVLVFRTITTVINRDYIFDFVFHQNGAVEVRSIPTGYIMGTYPKSDEKRYGNHLHKHLHGNIHQYLFNYRIDIDIKGIKNRFEMLNIEGDKTDNRKWGGEKYYYQNKFRRKLVSTEKEAAYKFDFSRPKYLVFSNDKFRTEQGIPRSYRIQINSMSKELLPLDRGTERSRSWSRYQLAVTVHKDNETRSSSEYVTYDGLRPLVDFQKYIDDDESIVDQDLVVWVTLGSYRIPHMEDLPVIPTVGEHHSFFLLPFNYFNEDPSVGSRNAIRMERLDDGELKIQRYGVSNKQQCVPKSSKFDDLVTRNPNLMFGA
ncbi:putative amine oxidase [copper-containing] [Octopus sinensis]|uniref:Amine oxidase n=1 Tax=Octopus sinensis TaxID=2607531 RepID=A0A6P7TA02_9MOLL|nr:putative amine oxidase [copper-containing] [Octopus sinensis]